MRSITILAAVAAPFFCAVAPIASSASVRVTDPLGVTLGLDENDLESVTLAIDRAALDTRAGGAPIHRAIRSAARPVCASCPGDGGAAAMQDCRTEPTTAAEAQLAFALAGLGANSTLHAAR